jgi:hypothetical protein
VSAGVVPTLAGSDSAANPPSALAELELKEEELKRLALL